MVKLNPNVNALSRKDFQCRREENETKERRKVRLLFLPSFGAAAAADAAWLPAQLLHHAPYIYLNMS